MQEKYDRILIYCLSGTGNALKGSRWIKEYAESRNIFTEIYLIDRFDRIDIPHTNENLLIGFAYPTHGFMLPWFMLKFILQFPKRKNTNIFFLNTRAGTKFGRIYFPGISGAAMLLPLIIMLIKGFGVKGMLPLDLPSNWISLHPGLSDKAVREITDRRKQDTLKFISAILSRGYYYHYKVFAYFPLDIAVLPVSAGYFLIGRFFLSKSFMTSYKCGTCRLCEENCPKGALKIIDNRPYWSLHCESCMRCMNICPKNSIQTAHSFFIPLLYLTLTIPYARAVYLYLRGITGKLPYIIDYIMDVAITWGISLLIFYLMYWIFFYLIRWKLPNKLFTFTSLTKYWRRYIAEGITVKDFRKSQGLRKGAL